MDTSEKIDRQRIAKRMARAGLCSRRDAEAWIVAGRVKVNGEILLSPARDVGLDDVILVDDAPLPSSEKTRLFLFHKPRGLITSDHDPEGRETVADYLRENWPDGPRVVTVGRLDINTEGLLLLTNDGGLARVLELPETGWLRRYRVRAKGETDQATLDGLAEGIEIDGIAYAGIEAKLDRLQGSNCWLSMGLREGKNREIKRVLEHIGLEVNRLIRLSFGPFQLLDLPDGAVEEVRTRVLRDQLGATLAAAAGAQFDDEGAPPTAAPSPSPAARRLSLPADPGASPRAGLSRSQTRARPNEGGRGDDALRRRSAAPEIEQQRERAPRAADTPRRHVSKLRTGRREDAKPRKRIERTDTKDRRDRTIKVERLVRPEAPVRPGDKKRGSLSAEAKRVRTARSGGAKPERGHFGDTGARRGPRPDAVPRDRESRDGAVARESRGESARPRTGRSDATRNDRGRPSAGARGESKDARAPREDHARGDRTPRQDRASIPFRRPREDASGGGKSSPDRAGRPNRDGDRRAGKSAAPGRFSRERSGSGDAPDHRRERPSFDKGPSSRPAGRRGGPPSGKPPRGGPAGRSSKPKR